MTNIKKLIMALLLLHVCAMVVLAQTTQPAKRIFKHNEKIEVKYDKFEDKTTVSILMHIASKPDSSLALYVTDSNKGQSFEPSGQIGFAVLSDKSNLLSDINSTLYLLVDGKRLKFEAHYSSFGSRLALIPYMTFLEIANAKKVEGKLGTIEFELGENHLEALRDFVSRTAVEIDPNKVFRSNEVTQGARIISKPEAEYTEEARKNLISGRVVLKAVLSSSGQVTNIEIVNGLPHGLTEKAIEAAKKIRFKPAMKAGRPVSVSISVLEYNFNPY